MNDKNKKSVIFIILGVALVVIGLGITFFVVKKPFSENGEETSEKKAIQLDVPGQTSEVIKAETGEDKTVPTTSEDTKDKDKEKTSEKKTTTGTARPTVTSENTSETKKVEEPVIIIENEKNGNLPTPSPSAQPSTTTSSKSNNDVIELPFVPYEEIKIE